MKNLVYLNGSLVPREEAKISIFEGGFLYGYGLFETMRVYQGRVFRLEKHLQRLFQSAKIINLKIPQSFANLREAIKMTLAANKLKEAYVRLTLSQGEKEKGLISKNYKRPSVIIVAEKFIPYPEDYYKKGIRVIILKTRRNNFSPLSKVKSTNFLNNILGKIEAEERGVEEGIFLNSQGFLTEGTVSNLFLISENLLLTPSLKTGILPGITRKVILELAPGLGLKIKEREIRKEETEGISEAFLTNSLREVVPLVEIEGNPVGEGKPGPFTRRIHRAYQDLVQKELR